jgi:hypothetical protein
VTNVTSAVTQTGALSLHVNAFALGGAAMMTRLKTVSFPVRVFAFALVVAVAVGALTAATASAGL